MASSPAPAVDGRAWRAATPVVLVVAGLLLATTARTSHSASLRDTGTGRLADLVAAQQRQVSAATATERRLQQEVDAMTAAGAQRDAQVAAVRDRGAALAGPVGLLPVHGPGYTVSLDDAPRDAAVAPGYRTPSPDDLVVHQQDVQAVVNALWAGGGEAMTIMGQRVIATSAVRCVGNTLLLHGQVYSPPFVVSAIGDPARLAAAVAAAPGVRLFREYAKAYGLRIGTRRDALLAFPGYDGPLRLDYAHVLTGASAP